MQKALVTMLRMQDGMNTRVHEDWISQNFAWHRAIWIECAELVDHYGYKWWKAQNPDMEQVQLEAVDIWHFGMSSLFTEGKPLESMAEEIAAQWHAAPGIDGVVDATEYLAGIAASQKRFDVPAFVSLLTAVELDFDELFRQYLGKNVLNFFRQDHGYKVGSYRKVWDGREDNEHLMELLADINTSSADAEEDLYRALAARYDETQ